MFKQIKKADVVLFVLLAAMGLCSLYFTLSRTHHGASVVITVQGQLYGKYDLAKNQTIQIDQKDDAGNLIHRNTAVIKDNTVEMVCSDCKNQVCVYSGKIGQDTQSIVCLPNRVMIEITGTQNTEDALDAVAK